jgi:hypothetical protein
MQPEILHLAEEENSTGVNTVKQFLLGVYLIKSKSFTMQNAQ